MLETLRNRWPYLFETELYGNAIAQWISALVVAAAVYLIAYVVIKLAQARGSKLLRRLDEKWSDVAVDVLQGTKKFFLVIFALFIASGFLVLPERSTQNVQRVFLVVLLWQLAIWGLRFIGGGFGKYVELSVEDGSRATTLRAMSFIAKILFIVMLLLWGLDNFGVNIAALVAGLGIGGIAIALAVQNILGDLFASLTIVLDKPFVIGDFIVVGEYSGTIEHIGLKTTRLRSLSGEQLVFSNADLLQSRIRNYRRMDERRVSFLLGVVYDTPVEKLAKIGSMLGEIISAQEGIRFDRAHLMTFADSSLNYEVVYNVLSRDFNVYADVHQAINLEIFRRFKAEGIGFAYPSQSLYIESVPKGVLPKEASAKPSLGLKPTEPLS